MPFTLNHCIKHCSGDYVARMDADDISYCYYIKNNKIEKEEFIYVHLKRRKMKIDIDQNTENYLITPSGFAPMREITAEYIREQNRYKGIYPVYLQEKKRAFLNRFKK